MEPSLLSIFPPIFVIILAFYTRKTILALAGGIISAAIIATQFNLKNSFLLIIKHFWGQMEVDNIYNFSTKMIGSGRLEHIFVFTFLIALGVVISFINYTKGPVAYSSFIKKQVKNAIGAEFITVFSSLFFFIDDYFSSLTMGRISHPLTDKTRIPRTKLAFLTSSMATPLSVLSPISTWCAMITIQLKKAGIYFNIFHNPTVFAKPFKVYLHTIPYVFYSFIIIFGVLFIVASRISFGPMKKDEKAAIQSEDLSKEKSHNKHESISIKSPSMLNFLVPLCLFIGTILFFVLYIKKPYLKDETNSFLLALKNADIYLSLFLGSIVSLPLITFYFLARKIVSIKESLMLYAHGFMIMKNSIILLSLVWIFGAILKSDLHSGQYLAGLLSGHISISYLPVIFFLVSAFISLSTGSSWATAAILIPIVVPMCLHLKNLTPPVDLASISILVPVLGAILSGAVAGSHTSLKSDTTIMNAESAGVNLHKHFYSQLAYAAPAIFSSAFAFLLTGLLQKHNLFMRLFVPLLSGITIYLILLYLCHSFYKFYKTEKN
ncbi:hypothetical protein HN446_04180 [bacterium]|jgi:tetracycline resistance efflux pump|nr:hypothetical protein [bacterium]